MLLSVQGGVAQVTGFGTSGMEMLQKQGLPVVAAEKEQCLLGWHWWGTGCALLGSTRAGIPWRNGTDSG